MAKKAEAQDQSKQPQDDTQLLEKCNATGINGVDWAALLKQFGPIFLNMLIQLLQRSQPLMGATGDKTECTSEQLACVDECIEKQASCLALMVSHRHCCCEKV